MPVSESIQTMFPGESMLVGVVGVPGPWQPSVGWEIRWKSWSNLVIVFLLTLTKPFLWCIETQPSATSMYTWVTALHIYNIHSRYETISRGTMLHTYSISFFHFKSTRNALFMTFLTNCYLQIHKRVVSSK